MRKVSFLFLISIIFLANNTNSFAATSADLIPPIKTSQSITSPCTSRSSPGDTCANYAANNIENDKTISCTRSYTISNTFDPKKKTATVVTTDPNGKKTTTTQDEFIEYTPDKIEQNVALQQPFSAMINRYNTVQLTNNYDLCASDEERHNAMIDYSIGTGLNVAVRTTTPRQQKCLKGQRMVKAALTLSALGSYNNNTTNDTPIAWSQGGSCTSRSASGDPIRFSQVINTLKNDKIFYNPDAPCTDASKPVTLDTAIRQIADSDKWADDILKSLASKGTTPHAGQIYTNLNLTDAGPVQENLTVYRISATGKEDPTKVKYNVPLGAINNPNSQFVFDTHIGYQQTRLTRDVCTSPTDNDMMDNKSPITFLGFVRNLLQEANPAKVFDQSVTITKTLKTKQDFSPKVVSTQDAQRTQMSNFMTLSQQQRFNSLSPNSTADKATAAYGSDNDDRFNQVYKRLFYSPEQIKKYNL